MALETRALSKHYGGRAVVDEVSIRVEQGEVVGLLGPNGAGKTTTFHSIVGFAAPDGGHILLDDADITGLPMYRRAQMGIGYLPQETSIFRKLSVADNIRAVLEAQGIDKARIAERQRQLLTELDLLARADQRADTLSGGETRRVEIARALACEPHYMLLDEPFAGIDPRTVEDIQKHHCRTKRPRLGGADYRSQCARDLGNCRARLYPSGWQNFNRGHGRGAHCQRAGAANLSRRAL